MSSMLKTAARLIANGEPQMLGDYDITLTAPTTLKRGQTIIPMRWDIHAGFSRQVANLYEAKIKSGYPLTEAETEIVCGGVRNYREILKALFLTMNRVDGKPVKGAAGVVALALNFSRGIQ